MSGTPQTDAAAFRACPPYVQQLVVDADFARAQERRIAELEARLRHRVAVCNCGGGPGLCASCQDDEAILS